MTSIPIGTVKSLDQFFTRPPDARRAWKAAIKQAQAAGIDPKETLWVEPSAGAGVFIDNRPDWIQLSHVRGYDIEPRHDAVVRGNFFNLYRKDLPAGRIAVIGNPPFGLRAKTALAFVNHAILLMGAEFVTFIVPSNAASHSYQSRYLHDSIGVSNEVPMDNPVFVLPSGTKHKLNTSTSIITFAKGAPRARRAITEHDDFYIITHSPGSRGWLSLLNSRWAVACKASTTGEVVMTRRQVEESNGMLVINFLYPLDINSEELYSRIKALDWKSLRKTMGLYRGNFSGRHIVDAYTAEYGGKSRVHPQSDLFC